MSYFARGAGSEFITVNQQINTISGNESDLNIDLIEDSKTVTYSQSWNYSQTISGLNPGTYLLVTSVIVDSSNETISTTQRITVQDLSDDFDIQLSGAMPLSLKPNSIEEVTFFVKTYSQNLHDSIALTIEGDLNLSLNDEGVDGDLIAHNGGYAGTLLIDTSNLQVGTCLTYHVRGQRGSTIKTGDDYQLCVSSFDTRFPQPSVDSEVVDPIGFGSYAADEITIKIEPNTSEEIVNQIAQDIGGVVFGWNPQLNYVYIKLNQPFSSYADLESLISALEAESGVESAFGSMMFESATSSNFTPEDSLYSKQWGLEQVGANAAWSLGYRGLKSTMIAVIDTGVDYNHPDLKNRVIRGHNHVEGNDDPMDPDSHGTGVAGVIGAETNNAKGVSGVTWHSKILAIRALHGNGVSTPLPTIVQAITEAINSEATVINASLGARSVAGYRFCEVVDLAKSRGAIVVAAAGNDDSFVAAHYPSSCENAVSVGALTKNDERYPTSNYGPNVDIAAPGEFILSTGLAEKYQYRQQTSFATPFVSGAIAIVLDKYPEYTPQEAAQRILDTADELPQSVDLGVGRLNIFRAVADHGLITESASSGALFVAPGTDEWISRVVDPIHWTAQG